MIWSTTISAKKAYSIENETSQGELLHITKLSLGSQPQSNSANVFVNIESSKYPIASLSPSKKFLKTDLYFNTRIPAVLTAEGLGEVIIVGNLEPISLSHTPSKSQSEIKLIDLPIKRPPIKLQQNTQILKKAKIEENKNRNTNSWKSAFKKPINENVKINTRNNDIKILNTKATNSIVSNSLQIKKKQEINSKIKNNCAKKKFNEKKTKFLEIKERMEQWRGGN